MNANDVRNFLRPASEGLERVLKFVKRASEGTLIGISTGFRNLDEFTNGIRNFVVLGGSPKIGKSTFALNIAQNVSAQGNPVIYIDCENGPTRLLLKTLMRTTGLTFGQMIKERSKLIESLDGHSEIAHKQVEQNFQRLTENLYIHRPSPSDFPNSKTDILEAPKRLFKKYNWYFRDQLGVDKEFRILIVIDSLQKLPLWNMSERRACVDIWLRAIEWARDEFDFTFLVISELARGRYDERSLDSFKESGDIEYSADLAMQLIKSKNERGEEILELEAVANRDGESGLIGTFRPNWALGYLEELPNKIIRQEFRSNNGSR